MKFQTAAIAAILVVVSSTVASTTSSSGVAVDAFSFAPRRQQLRRQQLVLSPTVGTFLSPKESEGDNNNNNINNNGSVSGKKFSLANLFSGSSEASSLRGSSVPSTGGAATTTLEPHPSKRDHINPLNAMYPPNRASMESSTISTTNNNNYDRPLPFHPSVISGVLPNGFSYVFLPNRSPPNRFEAHLQVFSGSADELYPQQGIAHLTEHVAYMGSRKRERLFGTGSQTNAYTDFHHTVFYAACPTYAPGSTSSSNNSNNNNNGGGGNGKSGTPMLPMALDALCDVMEARCEPSRIEKERQAVLSEMTMVNTIEYRVECQILSTLHRENRLAKRFPIGKECLIQRWNQDDVKTWHRTHYRPDNVLLYVVGDLDPQLVERTIVEKFGHLSAEKQASQIKILELKEEAKLLADAIVEKTMKQAQSWHYPPVRHDFILGEGVQDVLVEAESKGRLIRKKPEQEDGAVVGKAYDIHLRQSYDLDDKVQFLNEVPLAPGRTLRPHIFQHELLQNFSFHLFAKRPVEPINDMASFRRSLARRICLAALQIRLNVGGRSDDPAFTFVEFNQLDSAREGCAVCSLDMTSEPHRWEEAVEKSISEIRKLGLYGVTPGEMERYASALLTDAEQLAAQGDMISHGDQLAYLMETVANGHTFMSPEQSNAVTEQALRTLTLEEVNDAAARLCAHITGVKDIDDENDGLKMEAKSTGVVVAVACTPKSVGVLDERSSIDEERLCAAIRR